MMYLELYLIRSSSLFPLLLLVGLPFLFGLAGGESACMIRPLPSFHIVDFPNNRKEHSLFCLFFLMNTKLTLTNRPSFPNSNKNVSIKSRDFSSHLLIMSIRFSPIFSMTRFPLSFKSSNLFCRRNFFSYNYVDYVIKKNDTINFQIQYLR